ncbi:BNR-4 repeat-containing protein [Catenovulum maritimum]|nr:BNR-4 repeat-containing protein [Catenovulum maritimum]
MKLVIDNYKKIQQMTLSLIAASFLVWFSGNSTAAIKLEHEIKVTDQALFFDGVKKSVPQARTQAYIEGQKYNYAYGNAIAPHGDAIKVYKNYVFMTWYRGGILDRHVMLTRYNTLTGKSVTIEFPHQHTGFEGRWWVGETHNTIAVAISPKDETIHLLYDMHAYRENTDTGGNGDIRKDYFRYSYSLAGAASVTDNNFTLTQFVKDTSVNSEGATDYKHLTMTGIEDHGQFSRLTYPTFFTSHDGDLFLHMRQGSSHDGRVVFNKYLAEQGKWSHFKSFNVLGAGKKGEIKNWSIYGKMKYADGKIRIGFQRRFNLPDRFRAQDGMFYAYSDDPSGETQWKNYKGEAITMPLVKADEALVMRPGDLLPDATAKDQVSITGGFDWTVTENGDLHLIGQTNEWVNKKVIKKVYSHTYQKAGVGELITTTDFPPASQLYTAGENIYIIGLEQGRPFVEQAKGGTNDFTRVYYAPVGSQSFQKGIVHIHDGKLYYYLLEKGGAGDKRTTYLQIINLDIDSKSYFKKIKQ